LTAHYSGNTIVPIEAPTTIKARALKDGQWSALAEIPLDITIPPQEYHHLKSPLLPNQNRGFFQLRINDYVCCPGADPALAEVCWMPWKTG